MDTAADLGKLKQHDGFISARRAVFQAGRHWYPTMVDLHKFIVAVSKIEVNNDGYGGGTAPAATVWGNGSILKVRSASIWVIVDASLPGPPGFWDSSWCSLSCSPTTQENVAVLPLCAALKVLLTWVDWHRVLDIIFSRRKLLPPTYWHAGPSLVHYDCLLCEIRQGCQFLRVVSFFRPPPAPFSHCWPRAHF